MVFVTDLNHGDSQEPGHIDIGFALNPEHPEAPVLWDCSAGVGTNPAALAEFAARVWLETTAPTLLELLEYQGRLATHFSGDDPEGLPGLHVVHGPVLGFGACDASPLRDWAVDNTLRAQRDTLPSRITGAVHGVKVLFGGMVGQAVAEVRVDGAYDEASSSALADLPWPRLEKPAFARAYLVVMPSADG